MESILLKRIETITGDINNMLEEKQELQRKLRDLQLKLDVSCGVLIELKHIIEESVSDNTSS